MKGRKWPGLVGKEQAADKLRTSDKQENAGFALYFD